MRGLGIILVTAAAMTLAALIVVLVAQRLGAAEIVLIGAAK